MKRLLLIATPYMGIYKDIMRGLNNIGIDVEFISQKNYPNNPYFVLNKKWSSKQIEQFQMVLLKYWKDVLDKQSDENLFFDYLFVINGLTLHPYLFEKLRKINKRIKAYNYIFDRVNGVYQIDHNFSYFDNIYTFDQINVRDYGLKLLPIFWVPVVEKRQKELDVFAFGGDDCVRAEIFRRIKRIADKANCHSFIKLYYPKDNNNIMYIIKRFAKYLIQRRTTPSLKDFSSGFYTNKTMSTDMFRTYINSSKVIVDTNHPYQDGLTARFMWALGAGKKIITTNLHAKDYKFYTKEQILILDNSVSDEDIVCFIKDNRKSPDHIKTEIDKYRIDNWLKTILEC